MNQIKRSLLWIVFSMVMLALFCACQEEAIDKEDEGNGQVSEEYPTEGPVKAEIIYEGEKPRLYRNGQPYFVKGAAYNNFIDLVPAYGGNSIRTYGVNEDTQAVLDSALENKLTVCLGIWVNRETDGFDYDNEQEVVKQKERIRQEVLQFKDHSAVMIWGIGNEVDSRYTNYKVWNFIGEVSDMIHELDTNHLTTTVLAGADPTDIVEIAQRAPSLDILSVNTYNAISLAQGKIAGAGWTKPYMITEWGPNGTWGNVATTPWGGIYELTSTEKAQVYTDVYSQHIAANINKGCIGSYTFLWGYQTHGAVATWYGLFTTKKKPLAAAQSMYYSWKGGYPANRAPRIESSESLTLNGKTDVDDIVLKVGDENYASIKAVDLEGDQLTYEWQIVREGLVISRDQRFEGSLPGLEGLFTSIDQKSVTFNMPGEGEYRLYAFVHDSHENVAFAAIPFKVEK